LPQNENMCYFFEMVTARNVIIVRPEKDEIILHGCRDMITLEEKRPQSIAEENGWKCIKTYPLLHSLEEVQAATKKLNPIQSGCLYLSLLLTSIFRGIRCV